MKSAEERVLLDGVSGFVHMIFNIDTSVLILLLMMAI